MALIIYNTKRGLIPPESVLRFQGGLTSLTIVDDGYTVNLNAAGSNDPDGTIINFEWQKRVAGGSWITLANTTTTVYQDRLTITNNYEYRLICTDNEGLTATSPIITIDYTQEDVGLPVAYINGAPERYSSELQVNNIITLFADGSLAGSNIATIVSYSWIVTSAIGTYRLTNSQASTAYFSGETGSYGIQLTIENNKGEVDTNTAQINVIDGVNNI